MDAKIENGKVTIVAEGQEALLLLKQVLEKQGPGAGTTETVQCRKTKMEKSSWSSNSTQDAILNYLKTTTPGMNTTTTKELAKELALPSHIISHNLWLLKRANQIQKIGGYKGYFQVK